MCSQSSCLFPKLLACEQNSRKIDQNHSPVVKVPDRFVSVRISQAPENPQILKSAKTKNGFASFPFILFLPNLDKINSAVDLIQKTIKAKLKSCKLTVQSESLEEPDFFEAELESSSLPPSSSLEPLLFFCFLRLIMIGFLWKCS